MTRWGILSYWLFPFSEFWNRCLFWVDLSFVYCLVSDPVFCKVATADCLVLLLANALSIQKNSYTRAFVLLCFYKLDLLVPRAKVRIDNYWSGKEELNILCRQTWINLWLLFLFRAFFMKCLWSNFSLLHYFWVKVWNWRLWGGSGIPKCLDKITHDDLSYVI